MSNWHPSKNRQANYVRDQQTQRRQAAYDRDQPQTGDSKPTASQIVARSEQPTHVKRMSRGHTK
jgi:hypothetical protein